MIEHVIPAGDGWIARVRCSERTDGDFCWQDRRWIKTNRHDCGHSDSSTGDRGDVALDPNPLSLLGQQRQALMCGRWTWLRQEHGARVVSVDVPGGQAGSTADGAVTDIPKVVLAVHSADCAPVVVAGGAALGVAHVGWRGLLAGVTGEVVRAVKEKAHGPAPPRLRAVIGPLIRPSNYEFDVETLAKIAARCSPAVRAVTAWDTPALDLAAAVRASLNAAGVHEVDDLGLDTAQHRFYSHRVRADRGRHATVARLETATTTARGSA